MRSTKPISALAAGHEAADLRHQDDQRDLANVSRFAGHVRPGDDCEPQLLAVELGVVRHELFFGQLLIEHGMAAILQITSRRESSSTGRQ